MTGAIGHAPRSAVLGPAGSRLFVVIPDDAILCRAGQAGRPESLPTPERLRP